MDLKVKTDFPNPQNIILPFEGNGRKGITIISERGYIFAQDIKTNKLL